MKFFKILTLLVVIITALSACKEKKADKKEVIAIKTETASFHISGMTCEIGCAKTIQSKLSKKEGVSSAKVVFSDSIATVKFDANQISKKELISFIDGIAGGDLYKASELQTEK